MESNLVHLVPWELPGLELSDANKLPSEPGIYLVYRHYRVLFIDYALTSLRNRWFKDNISQHLKSLDSVVVAYYVVPQDQVSELEKCKLDLIKLYDPQYNGKTQKKLQEYQGLLQRLTKENRTLKALIKKERAIHKLALCQSKLHLSSKLLAEIETSLEKASNIDEWTAQDKTIKTMSAISSVLEEISETINGFSNLS